MSKTKSPEFIDIPSGWGSSLLGREDNPVVTIIRNGLTIPQNKEQGLYKITRIETIGRGFIDEKRVRYVSNVNQETCTKYIIRKGDILFSHINSDPHIGKTAIATRDYPDLLHGMNLLLLRPNPDVVDPYFLNFVFNYYRQVGVFIQICSRAVNQSSINQEKLKALEIPIPPLPEQHRIAYVLTTIQNAIAQQEQLIDLTTKLKRTLMHKLFTEGLHGEKQKQTEIGLIPNDFEMTRLGNIAKFQSGGTPSRNNPEYWIGGTIPWVKTTEIAYRVIETTEEYITQYGLKNSSAKVIPKGSLLIAMYGQGITRGRVGILGIEAATNQACVAVIPLDEKQILTWFIYYYLQFHYRDLRDLAHGANQLNLNQELIKSFPLSFPKIEEQQIIVNALSVLDKKLLLIERKKEKIEELFRTLLHQLMTAQIRVNNLVL